MSTFTTYVQNTFEYDGCIILGDQPCPGLGLNPFIDYITPGCIDANKSVITSDGLGIQCTYTLPTDNTNLLVASDFAKYGSSAAVCYNSEGRSCTCGDTDCSSGWEQSGQTWNNIIMNQYCLQSAPGYGCLYNPTTETTTCPNPPWPNPLCPIDPSTGFNMTSCANLLTSGDIGNWCRLWYDKYPSKGDAQMPTYCGGNGTWDNPPDCGCILAATNPFYQKFLSGGIPAGKSTCWYIPCTTFYPYLVTKDILNKTCPSTVCEQVNQFTADNSSQINVGQLNESVSCGKNSSDFDTWWIVYLIYFGIFLLVVIIFLSVFNTFYKK